MTGTETRQHFVVETHREGTVEVVVVRGDADPATVPLLAAVLDTVVARRPERVEVDLSGVTYLDARALTVLSTARRRLGARRAVLALRHPGPVVAQVLEVAGMTNSFQVVDRSLCSAG